MTARARRVSDHQYADEAANVFARRLEEARAFGAASDHLSSTRPEFSARSGLTIVQRLLGWLAVLSLIAGLVFSPDLTLLGIEIAFGAVFGIIIVLRITSVLSGRLARQAKPSLLPDHQLETITYLVPLKDEPNVVASLIEAITQLDYPRHKLDVKLLIEADDDRTLNAVLAANPPAWFEIIPVPPGEPRTKPKALNYGLNFARGEIIAILDAEDRPDAGQSRAAAEALRLGDRRLAVVQAPLAIHNGADGWLARQFEVEYAIHFNLWLPFLARLNAPLALGGTSNYFRRDWLNKAGGWDAWNVTEDADIGLRLARLGARATTITPPTWEEAPARMRPWFNQRTRWMKGHLQTWLVLMRQPFRTASGMGFGHFALMQLTFGGALLACIMHLPLFAFIAYSALTLSFETWHAALFGMGYASVVAAAVFAKAKHAGPWTLLTLPFYWPLLSLAMLRALVDMKRKPHFWAKTPHGRPRPAPASRMAPGPEADNVVQLDFDF